MKLQLITIAALTVGFLAVPTTAHAVDIPGTGGGIDCATETMYYSDLPTPGAELHYAAVGYEVESYCGHPATIVWTDAQIGQPYIFVVLPDGTVQYWVAEPAASPAPVSPAPIVESAPIVTEPIAEPAPAVVLVPAACLTEADTHLLCL